MMQEFYAAAIKHTEAPLCDELRELGFKSVRLNRGGIPFRGTWRDGWRACLQSRIAQRIYVLLSRFPVSSNDQLYDGVRAIDWSPYLTPNKTLSVNAVTVGSTLDHSGFVALKTKDAIVDQLRETQGGRPSVDRDNADVRVFVYLANNKAVVYVDLSGESLHRRGYRQQAGDAPLRETLAAAILRLSGWDRTTPLIDPLCGSGTIAIEAALWAANIAPGLSRERFGFERWACFSEDDSTDLRTLRGEMRALATKEVPRIVGTDNDPNVLDMARANARAAGVRLTFREQSALDVQRDGGRRTLVSNPPYGVRIEAEPEFPQHLAAAISKLHDWRVALLAGTNVYEKSINLRPKEALPLVNGSIDCRLLIYEVP